MYLDYDSSGETVSVFSVKKSKEPHFIINGVYDPNALDKGKIRDYLNNADWTDKGSPAYITPTLRSSDFIKEGLSVKQMADAYLPEAGKNNFEVYHQSYYSAVEEVKNYLVRNKLEYNEDSFTRELGMHGRGNLEVEETLRANIELNDGRSLSVQIYRMSPETWELNMYVAGRRNRRTP